MVQQTSEEWRNAPVRTISIVIPVYNEEATVQDLVGLVVKAPLPAGVCSTDHLRQ